MNINLEIQKVFKTGEHQCDEICNFYGNAKLNDKIIEILQVSIKDCLGNFRSSLDYLAHHIVNENDIQIKPKLIQFPILSVSLKQFQIFMQNKFSNLQIKNSDLYDYLESIQYYHDNIKNRWMLWLAELNNQTKHVKLSEHTFEKEKFIFFDDGKKITIIFKNFIIAENTFFRVGNRNIPPTTINLDNSGPTGFEPEIGRGVRSRIIFDDCNESIPTVLIKIKNGVEQTIKGFETIN